jgi:transcriptional antiterminator RfaH
MALAWYVIRSKPNKEEFFWSQLLARRFETYYPSIPSKAVNPRARKVKPYFPGYVFIHVDLQEVSASALHWLPGSAGLVSFDREPASVPDALIALIRRKVDQINQVSADPLHGLKPGDTVTIMEGPFAGQEAIFDSCRTGSQRVRVLIQLLQSRQLPVELPAAQVERKS